VTGLGSLSDIVFSGSQTALREFSHYTDLTASANVKVRYQKKSMSKNYTPATAAQDVEAALRLLEGARNLSYTFICSEARCCASPTWSAQFPTSCPPNPAASLRDPGPGAPLMVGQEIIIYEPGFWNLFSEEDHNHASMRTLKNALLI